MTMGTFKDSLQAFRSKSLSEQVELLSPRFFVVALVLTAIIMPLDRVRNMATTPPYLSLIVLLMLLQRPLLWGWQKLKYKTGQSPDKLLALAFALPALSALVSTYTAYNRTVAIVATLLLVFVLIRGWVLAQYIRARELEIFERAVLIVTVVVLVFGFYQYIGDVFGLPQSWTLLKAHYSATSTYPFPRIQSFALEPLYLAHFLFLPIGILLVKFHRQESANRYEEALLAVTLAVFILTLSRGAILGLLVTLAAFMAVARSWRLVLYTAKHIAVAVLIVALMLVLAGNVKKSSTIGVFADHAIDLNDGSARTRYDLWPVTIKIFLDHPLTGVGPNNSRILLHDGGADIPNARANRYQPVNNDYLAYLSEEGVLGIVCILPLLWLIGRSFWETVRSRLKHPSAPYALALAGMAIQANAFHSLLLLRTWVVIGLLLAGVQLVRDKQKIAD